MEEQDAEFQIQGGPDATRAGTTVEGQNRPIEDAMNLAEAGDSKSVSVTHGSVYVDASDVGIGIFFADKWQDWRLKTGWKEGKNREIQWAEAVAVDLGVRLLIEAGYAGKEIILHSDNQQVVDAISHIHPIGPREGFAEQVVRKVIELCRVSEIRLSAQWIRGVCNLADRASRLQFEPTENTRIPYHVEIPSYLQEFVVPYE